jgi:hypothetical protein
MPPAAELVREPAIEHRRAMRNTIVLALALVGCHRTHDVEYHRVEFPGFSAELPTAVTYGKDSRTEYRAGQQFSKLGTRVVVINWQPGELSPPERISAPFKVAADVIRPGLRLSQGVGRAIKAGTLPATTIDGRAEGDATIDLTLVEIACGRRSVVFTVGGPSQTHEIRDRILATFECHPSADLDSWIASGAPIDVADSAALTGWFKIDREDFTISNGELILTALPSGHLPEPDDAMLTNVAHVLTRDGAEWQPVSTELRGGRRFQLGRLTSLHLTLPGVATVWNCPGRSDAVMAFAARTTDGDLSPALDFLATLRCSTPDSPPLPLVPMPR